MTYNLEDEFPLSVKRYKEINRPNKIRSEESFMKTLNGGDHPQDKFNPSIGVFTELIKPTKNTRITLSDSWSIVQVTRIFGPGNVPIYNCINMPMAKVKNKFVDVSDDNISADYAYNRLSTGDLERTYQWYIDIIRPNLTRWERMLKG